MRSYKLYGVIWKQGGSMVDYELTCIYWYSLGQFTISGDNSLVVFDEDASQQMWYCYLTINYLMSSPTQYDIM